MISFDDQKHKQDLIWGVEELTSETDSAIFILVITTANLRLANAETDTFVSMSDGLVPVSEKPAKRNTNDLVQAFSKQGQMPNQGYCTHPRYPYRTTCPTSLPLCAGDMGQKPAVN